ncbi:porin family protein [Mangrovimonas sp. CR14]|uniref:porin family protein n=1 Tax=Mangrovimonas sp. CR14 TaxID=2706120 RepID=UPI001421E2EA|nr:porin family protein [Mangrovimonas sp. CR14]NIK92608.1 porin family protein [Mangrovimonas sp. CR14]
MKSTYFYLLALLFSFSAIAQNQFIAGYFINESGNRTDCLIKDESYLKLPANLEYKSSENSDIQSVRMETIIEFGISEHIKYIKRKTKVDVSSSALEDLDYNQEPVFEEQEIFLRAIVEGSANLYFYDGPKRPAFYYQMNGGELEPLIYKTYLLDESYKITENNTFKKQIYSQLKCEGIQDSEIRNAKYKERDLSKLFIAYNECQNSNYLVYKKSQGKLDLNVSLRPGVTFSSLELLSPDPTSIVLGDVDYGQQKGIRVGVELELVLPAGKNKWAVFFEPTYQAFKASNDEPIGIFEYESTIDYQALDLNLGLRHYFVLSEKSKLFINASHAFVINFGDSKVDFDGRSDLDIKSQGFFAFGLGYKFMDRMSAEIRYSTNRNLLGEYGNWNTNFTSVSVILGYTFF